MRGFNPVLRLSVGLLIFCFGSVGAAGSERDDFADGEVVAEELKVSLRDRIGAEVLGERLHTEPLERERLLLRLGQMGTPRALGVLHRFLTEVPQLTHDEWRAAVRALTPYAGQRQGREWLFKVLVGAAVRDERRDAEAVPALTEYGPTMRFARELSAMALAASGDAPAIAALAQALLRGGEPALMARQALLAHPPRDLQPLVSVRGGVSPEWVETLGALGDQRAFNSLRHWVRAGGPAVQSEAAVALLKLGHLETVPLALHWLERTQEPLLVAAATEILLASASEESVQALKKLFTLAPSRALKLAQDYPRPALASVLIESFGAQTREGQRSLLVALGRSGGDVALKFLGEQLTRSEFRSDAALALARSPDDEARSVLERALSRGDRSQHAA
ncbi:MAG: hypothetical protein RJA70_2683, partial [Pseudomonadota bacterium]